MTDYVKATNFRIKDTLVTGDPNKIIKGTELDDEFNSIVTSIGTKANLASPSFSGTPTTPTPTSTDDSTQIANTAFVKLNGVPIGGIIMWGGSISSLPTGYVLCDGSGGTPDLRNRFIVGAGDTYSIGASGGSKDAIVPIHTHAISDPGHTHLVENYAGVSGGTPQINASTLATAGERTGVSTTGISVASTGEDATNKNLPPYYALAFIKRVS